MSIKTREKADLKSEAMLKFSCEAKEQFYYFVRNQFMETAKLSEDFKNCASEINRSGYSILRTAYRVDEYCKIAADKYSVKNKRWEIRGLLASLCEKANPFFEKEGLRLLYKFPQKQIFAEVDEEKLYYAVLELLLNAAESSRRGSKVELKLSVTKKYVKISVFDKGAISEEALQHCFEPFYCGKTNKKYRNLGIGLTLVQKFAEESGGKALVNAEKGTEAAIFLPMSELGEKSDLVKASGIKFIDDLYSPINIMLCVIEKSKNL